MERPSQNDFYMETNLLTKVRKIEIKTKQLSKHLFSGEYHSAFKGKGMAFSEVREYQYGDDVRNIDWNVTARLNHPYIKVFEEERELTVMLLIDVSGSHQFGTNLQFKGELMAEVSAILSFSAIYNNDKVGVIFFSDRIEKFIPPKKGTKHILRIIRELIDFKPVSSKTNLSEGLRYFTNVIKKSCTVFLLSDFYDVGFEDALKIASKKHDLVALRVSDRHEKSLPDLGLAHFLDPESGQLVWVDTSSRKIREEFSGTYQNHERYVNEIFKRYGIDKADIRTGEDYVKPLLMLFKKREQKM